MVGLLFEVVTAGSYLVSTRLLHHGSTNQDTRLLPITASPVLTTPVLTTPLLTTPVVTIPVVITPVVTTPPPAMLAVLPAPSVSKPAAVTTTVSKPKAVTTTTSTTVFTRYWPSTTTKD
jgi:hypothetical protein